MLWWLGALVILVGAGPVYQAVASALQLRRAPPPGKLVDVDGHRLYLHLSGEGTGPTVVLFSGNVSPAVLWYPVQAEVAQFARVVSYDRGGYGWSEPGALPRSGDQIVAELHALLECAGIPGHYLLVAHSLGGMLARIFASRYPDEVAGMVLVDAFEENIRRTYSPAMQRLDQQGRRVLLPLSWLGIMRMMFGRNPNMLTGGNAWLHRFPAALRPAIFGLMYHPRMVRASNQEWAVMAQAEEQLRSAGGLGDLPLSVLNAGRTDDVGGPGLSKAEWAAVHQANRDGQARLAHLSTRARHQIVQDSGHMIPLEQPEAVVSAIRQVLLEIAAQNG